MHYFHNLTSAFGEFAPRPPLRLTPWTPLEDFRPHTLNLPTPGKNSSGAQVCWPVVVIEFAHDVIANILSTVYSLLISAVGPCLPPKWQPTTSTYVSPVPCKDRFASTSIRSWVTPESKSFECIIVLQSFNHVRSHQRPAIKIPSTTLHARCVLFSYFLGPQTVLCSGLQC